MSEEQVVVEINGREFLADEVCVERDTGRYEGTEGVLQPENRVVTLVIEGLDQTH